VLRKLTKEGVNCLGQILKPLPAEEIRGVVGLADKKQGDDKLFIALLETNNYKRIESLRVDHRFS
jgi:hypothetical protein